MPVLPGLRRWGSWTQRGYNWPPNWGKKMKEKDWPGDSGPVKSVSYEGYDLKMYYKWPPYIHIIGKQVPNLRVWQLCPFSDLNLRPLWSQARFSNQRGSTSHSSIPVTVEVKRGSFAFTEQHLSYLQLFSWALITVSISLTLRRYRIYRLLWKVIYLGCCQSGKLKQPEYLLTNLIQRPLQTGNYN